MTTPGGPWAQGPPGSWPPGPQPGPSPYGPPQYGQPPHGQPPYGQPPYGQAPYGQAPYGGPPHGQPPYGYGPPAYGGYPPTQSYPTQGAPHPGWGPPPPRRGPGKLIAVLLVVVLVIAGIGIGTYFLTRGLPGADEAAAGELRTVRTSALSFPVPVEWVADEESTPSVVLGVPFEGLTFGPAYDCAGNGYFRGVAAAAFVDGEIPPAEVATAFGQETGAAYYTLPDGTPPAVDVGAARPVQVGGVDGQLVEVTVRAAADDGCLATTGSVLVLALSTTDVTGAPGTAVLVVNGDVEGGPAAAPPVPTRATLEAMIDGARLPGV